MNGKESMKKLLYIIPVIALCGCWEHSLHEQDFKIQSLVTEPEFKALCNKHDVNFKYIHTRGISPENRDEHLYEIIVSVKKGDS